MSNANTTPDTTNTTPATDEIAYSTHGAERHAIAAQRRAVREGRTNTRIVHEHETPRTNERWIVLCAPLAPVVAS